MPTTTMKAALIALPLTLAAAAPAAAGQWIVDLGRCPDHLEDIVDRSALARQTAESRGFFQRMRLWRERRENRRDEAITVCPADALIYEHSRGPADINDWPESVTLMKRRGVSGDDVYRRQLANGRLVPIRVIEAKRRDVRRFARQRNGRPYRGERVYDRVIYDGYELSAN